VGKWLNHAFYAIALNRDTYRMIAQDAYMTGPALLIMLLSQILQTLNYTGKFDIIEILIRFGAWLLAVVMLWLTSRLLRGNAGFSSTLRVAAFAQSAHVLELLGFIPVIGPLARFVAVLLTIIGVWLGTAVAHDLKGWRTLLLPIIYGLTTVVAIVFVLAAIRGLSVTIDGMLQAFGLAG